MTLYKKIYPSVLFIFSYFVDAKIPQYELAVLTLALLSAIFTWAHVVWAKNKISSALVIVFTVTMIFPLLGLYLLSYAHYPGWQVTLMKIYQVIVVHGPYMGFDFLLPFFIAVITVYLIKNYNKSHKPGGPQSNIS